MASSFEYANEPSQGDARLNEWVSEDDELCDAVSYRLAESVAVDASSVHVEAHDGEVMIEGAVESVDECELISAIAMTVPGVKAVHNATAPKLGHSR